MIYTVTFNPAIDYVVHTDGEFNSGAVNRSLGETFQLGGKGINVSAVLKELDTESTALGFTAGYVGTWLENGLAALGVKTDFISLESGMTRINVKIKSSSETELNGRGPDIPQSALDMLYLKLDTLKNGDFLVLAGSIPPSLGADTYEKIMLRLENRGIFIIADASGSLLLNVVRHKPFMIKPNNLELGEIFGKTLKTDKDIIECAHILKAQGARNVLVSMAGDGALLLDENGIIHRIDAAAGTVVNSVGAGDSMVAGFLAGWLQTSDYDYALRLGAAAGAATAFSEGLADKNAVYDIFPHLQTRLCLDI